MNARAQQFPQTIAQDVAPPRAEHISLESETDELAPARRAHRKVRATYVLRSKLRGCATELSLLEGHFLAVHSTRPGEVPHKYELDLRFANAKPTRVRHVSWRWLGLALGCALHSGFALWRASRADEALWTHLQLALAAATFLGATGAMLMFLRRTTESLQFTSVHGGATLISVTGGIGSARAGKTFFVALIKSITAAKIARPQPRPQLLRDEMREHHRLYQVGILSNEEYEASKARILAAH